MTEVSTAFFTVSHRSVSMLLARRNAKGYALGALALVAACGVMAALHDLRWVIVALMVVLLVSPLVLALLYLNHGLKKFTALNSLPHCVVFSAAGISLIVRRSPKPDPEEAAADTATAAATSGDVETVRLSIPRSRLGTMSVTAGGYLLIPVTDPDEGFLMIPETAFRSRDDIMAVANLLSVDS